VYHPCTSKQPPAHRHREAIQILLALFRHDRGLRSSPAWPRFPSAVYGWTALAPSLQAYFTQRLIGERAASPNTIASCKLAFQLLLAFASKATGKAPSSLDIADLDAPLIASFLTHLEQDRRNSVTTRNSRLAAIHSLFGYLALRHPEHAGSIQRVLVSPASDDVPVGAGFRH
jgi:hypothetical protein